MKILLLDIETAPNTAYVWGLFNENIPLARLLESSYTLCWAAKWYGEKKVFFDSVHKSTQKEMLKGIHALLNECDVVIHYNGTRFDIPILNKEFVLNGFKPPAPYKQVDLLRTARRQFRFTSNKLDYVADALGLGNKRDTTFNLWVECMANKASAWKTMEAYNKQDVALLEKVYDVFKPWIKGHANAALYESNGLVCPTCGSKHFVRRGIARTTTCSYQRFQCSDCGSWFRGTKNIGHKISEKYVHA